MLRNVIDKVQRPDQPPEEQKQEAENLTSPDAADSPIRGINLGAFGMALGTDVLIRSGIISNKSAQKLMKHRFSPEAVQGMQQLEKGDLEGVRNSILRPDFIQKNPIFVSSGQLIRKAIDLGYMDTAEQMLDSGYTFPKSIMIDSIKDENWESTRVLIQKGFHKDIEGTVLEFWYLLYQNQVLLAKSLLDSDPRLAELVDDRQLNDPKEMYLSNSLIDAAMRSALERSYDYLAALMLGLNPSIISKDMIYTALNNSCLEFIKKVWTGNYQLKIGAIVKRRKKQSLLWDQLEKEVTNYVERKELAKQLKISFIIDQLLEKKKFEEAKSILDWPGACDEPGVIRACIKYSQQELAMEYLNRTTMGVSSNDLEEAISLGQYELAVEMLQFKEARIALNSHEIQDNLMKMLENGEVGIYAIEMLNRIPVKNWHFDNTKELCLNLNTFARKKREIIVSHAPILFCVLVAEFLYKISEASLQHHNRCKATADNFIELGDSIEDSIKEEEELRYFLTQRDSRWRNVLTILSKNRFHELLKNEEIGTIVNKMWLGPKRNHGIMGASTIYKSFYSPVGAKEAMQFSRQMDMSKPYMFHYEQWTESCYYRYNAVAVSTIALVIFYQLVIYTAIAADAFMDVTENSASLVWLRISQFWIVSIIIQDVCFIVYGIKTGRGYEVDNWMILDFFMFLIMGTLTLDLHKTYFGEGNQFEDTDPVLFNAGLHSLMIVVIWLRFMSVLITTKSLGPFLRMIYLMAKEVVNFFIIFGCLGLCCAAVFTSLFNDTSPKFESFSISLRSLFAAALANFDLEAFTDNKELGGILLGVYLLMANVMLLNLLIALLSNIYSDLSVKVDAEHRAVVISYYNRMFWNNDYGVIIFLPPPFTYLNVILAPIVLSLKDPEKWNSFFCKSFYLLYVLPQFLFFAAGSMFYLPLLYITGFAIYGKTGLRTTKSAEDIIKVDLDQPEESEHIKSEESAQEGEPVDGNFKENQLSFFSWGKALAWTFIGIPWLFWALIRDFKDFWKSIFITLDINEDTERNKIKEIVTIELMKEFQIVLKSIKSEEISVNHFLQMWKMLNVEDEQKEKLIRDYLEQFCNSTTDATINVERMRRLLPKKEFYHKEYIRRAQHVNIPWIAKGVRKYQSKTGTMMVGGLALPRKVESGGGVLDLKHLDSIKRSANDMEHKYKELQKSTQTIRQEIETQNRLLSVLKEKKMQW